MRMFLILHCVRCLPVVYACTEQMFELLITTLSCTRCVQGTLCINSNQLLNLVAWLVGIRYILSANTPEFVVFGMYERSYGTVIK